jgi:hypothetical protein
MLFLEPFALIRGRNQRHRKEIGRAQILERVLSEITYAVGIGAVVHRGRIAAPGSTS